MKCQKPGAKPCPNEALIGGTYCSTHEAEFQDELAQLDSSNEDQEWTRE